MTKTATELMMDVAKRNMPNTLDALVDEYLRTHPDRVLIARDELRKFADWFRETRS